jgi:hypothetical protein
MLVTVTLRFSLHHRRLQYIVTVRRDGLYEEIKKIGKSFMQVLLIVPIFVILYTGIASAQEWAQTYGGTDYDRARSIQQTSDGGYIVAGEALTLLVPAIMISGY